MIGLGERDPAADEQRGKEWVEETLAKQTRSLKILQRVAKSLTAEPDLRTLVQLVTDGGRELSGAAFGAFFYNVINHEGESYTLYTLSGAPSEAFSSFPLPRKTEIFAPTFEGTAVLRLDDVTNDPRYGKKSPFHGMPPGHLAVRSYLAVPVISPSGNVLGGLFYGHPDVGVFGQEAEDYIAGLAAQAAVAIENARLQAAHQRELAALREAETWGRHFTAIVESSDDAIISKNLQGIIQSWNSGANRIFGYTADEVIGKPVTMLFPDGHIDEESAIIAKIRLGQRIEHYETKRRRKDGSILDISLTISPIVDASGNVVGASKIARDISHRKRSEEALERSAAELARSRNELEERVEQRTASLQEAIAQMEEFSYTVSHDVRAPLRAMGMHCRVLMEDYKELFKDHAGAQASLERIADNCTRLDRMTRDVLTYGKVARGDMKTVSVSLDRIVRQTIDAFPSMQPPDACVEVERLGTVMGNETLLSQLLSNLLVNAVKFVPVGVTPHVRIWAERSDGLVTLSIKDNGIGIEPAYHHRLFSIFERLHPQMSYEGTGVGLAIVRKCVDKMRGRVGVESDGKNGSLFWFTLPEGA